MQVAGGVSNILIFQSEQGLDLVTHFYLRFVFLFKNKIGNFSESVYPLSSISSCPNIDFVRQGVLADKVILGHLGPGLITQDLVVFQVD